MGLAAGGRWAVGLMALGALAVLAAACGETKEVVREVPVEKVVIKEVPVERIVEKEVVRTVEVEKPVVVTKEVVKEVPVERIVEKTVVQVVEKEKVVQVEKAGAAKEKRLNVRMASMPANMSPHTITSLAVAQTGKWTGSYLAQANPLTGQWAPDLASRWELAPDFSSMTFFLRKNAKWHDGTPVTAKDIEYTVRSFLNPEEASFMLASFTAVKGGKDFQDGKRKDVPGVVIIDDNTVKFVFEKPTAFFLDNLNNVCGQAPVPILPAHILDKIPPKELFQNEFWLKGLVGSGPWKFVQWVPDQFLEMVAFDDYYFGRPKIDRIVMAVIPSNEATEIALLRGEIDVTARGGVSVDAQKSFLADPRFDVYATMGTSGSGVAFNMRIPVINDPRLHQAIAYSLDRQLLFQTFANGLGKILQTPLSHSWYQKPEWDKLYPYDPDKARALLKEMKWDSNRVIKILVQTVTNPQTQANYTAIQQYLKDVGIQVAFETADTATYVKRIYVDHDWEINLSGGGGVQGGPGQYLSGRWVTCSASSCDPWGYAEYHFPIWDKLVAEGSLITDREQAAKFWQKLNEDYMLKDLPIIGDWIPASVQVKNKRFVMPHLGDIPKPSNLNQIKIYPVHIGGADWWLYHPEQWDLVQ